MGPQNSRNLTYELGVLVNVMKYLGYRHKINAAIWQWYFLNFEICLQEVKRFCPKISYVYSVCVIERYT